MADRGYLSIGEVLSLLRPEFPDLTISKIRFLESQGLLDPERTPSGYRKFYEADIGRLRWILTQQREQYLPLKVIKGRLGIDGDLDGDLDGGQAGDGGAGPAAAPAASASVARRDVAGAAAAADPRAGRGTARSAGADRSAPRAGDAGQPRLSGPGAGAGTAAAASPLAEAADNPLHLVRTGVSMTLDELADATELRADQVRELEQYGILAGRAVGGTTYYDEECLVAANLAAGFLRFGVEPRHLRMYKTAAEREAGFFEQLVLPLLKQRNPRARKQAMDTLVELSRLGQGLRAAMLRAALRDSTSG